MSSSTHSFQNGAEVTVYNQTMSGQPIIEGRATVVKPTDVGDQYQVRFPGDRTLYNRFVYPGRCQDDPQGYLVDAQKAWAERQGGAA